VISSVVATTPAIPVSSTVSCAGCQVRVKLLPPPKQ
jgi:hypothetical protein